MLLTKEIIDILNQLDYKNEFIFLDKNKVSVSVNGKELFSIEENGVFLNRKDVLVKVCESSDGEADTLREYEGFIKNISQHVLGLNHVGIRYSCSSIEKEIEWYVENVVDSDFSLFEEKSSDDFLRWFFLGNKTYLHSPLFEIVLSENGSRVVNDWTPHFQIDIDTDLEKEEIEKIAEENGLSDFIQWELKFPETGVVLVMGPLGKIGKTSIYLGLGTKKRNVQGQRNELKLV